MPYGFWTGTDEKAAPPMNREQRRAATRAARKASTR